MELCYEFLENNLRNDFKLRVQQQIFYEEQELWHILLSTIASLAYLSSRNYFHQDIRPASILIDKKGSIKVLPKPLFAQNFNSYIQHLIQENTADSNYLSPAQLIGLQKNLDLPLHNKSKSAIFALAICVIEAALLQRIDNIYNFKEFRVEEAVLKVYLEKVKEKYSEFLY